MAARKTARKTTSNNVLTTQMENAMRNLSVSFAAQSASAAIPAAQPYQEQFRVRKQVADRVSQPTIMQSMVFMESTREIRVFCTDGNVRKCKVDRLPTLEDGRKLWTKLQRIGKAGKEVSFVAAGGFSPDVWFYDIR